MPIELGIGQEQMDKESQVPPVADGTYEFVIDHVDVGNTLEGRPQLTWWLKILNRVEYPNRMLRYNTPLPWKDSKGEIDTSGVSFLNSILKAVGVQVVGTQSPDAPAYQGMTGTMRVSQKKRKDNPDLIDNVVNFPKRR